MIGFGEHPGDKKILKKWEGDLSISANSSYRGRNSARVAHLPILANMTLMVSRRLVERFHTNALGKVDSRFKNACKVNLVRYADDFAVTAATLELALKQRS